MTGIGSIDATPVATPGPSGSPQEPVVNQDVHATIPILRIGEASPLFTTAGPVGFRQAAASIGFAQARTATGGTIAIAGSDISAGETQIFEFRPWKIGVYQSTAHLQVPRGGALAVAFLDSAQRPAVAFIGDTPRSDLSGARSLEIYRAGAASTTRLDSYVAAGNSASFSESDAFAAFLPAHKEAGILTPAIAIVGAASSTTGAPLSIYEMFFPAAPIDFSSCAAPTGRGGPALCARPGVAMSEGHTTRVSAVVPGSSPKILSALGSIISPGTMPSAKGYLFDPETYTTATTSPGAGGPEFVGQGRPVPTTALSADYVAFFGGGDIVASATNNWGFLRVADSTLVRGAASMKSTRVENAVTLLDGRVFLVRGTPGGPDEKVVEFYVPTSTSETAGSFAFGTRLDQPGSCSTGAEQACVRLLVNRSNASATRIEGSATWLNGAVVIAGGADGPSDHGCEIFIPAYACAGSTPVRANGSPVIGADFCDRGRARELITDPENPSRLP